ncbi:flagellar protein FlaG [Pseudomonas sp. NC26]|uniref:flagellar protein FlaG n=1 Tax=unclassified Pseudomonas TaxID=196821 RepID=UPI00257C4B47|nr:MULTISPECIES: flagellar protein FlaG [unclassified Pseudomonas]MEC4875655.1 flagellar protein FlaG [Pseudomonas sp. NC26]
MDMSVKLNLSYTGARSAEQVAEKPVVRSTEQVKPDDDKKDPLAVQDTDKVKSAVAEIEKFLKASQRYLEFSTDEESGKIVVKVIATDSGELIRQLPSEEALRIAHSLSDVNSVLFDAKV